FLQNKYEREISGLKSDFEAMNGDGAVGKGHSMDLVVENLAKEKGRNIVNNQEIIEVTGDGGKTIKLNVDAVYKFFMYGHTILDGKKNSLNILKERYETYVTSVYKGHILKVEREMSDIEA